MADPDDDRSAADRADDDRVDLTELDVITRYSLAVRSATADRAELIAALRADLDWLEADRRPPAAARRTTARSTTSGRATTAKKATAGRRGARRSG